MSTSSPAVNPGPTPITSGAMSIKVPRFFFAIIASTTMSGLNFAIDSPLGSMITGTTPCLITSSTSSNDVISLALTPSIVISLS